MIRKYFNPKNDFAFKKIFGTEKNKDILIALLNDVVGNQLAGRVEDVTFLKSLQDPEDASKKQSIVDVLCRDETGNRYVIEMQVASGKGFEERAQYYASKAYTSQMKTGDVYEGLQKVIFIAFTDFTLYPAKVAYKSEHVILDKATLENNLDKLSFTFVELPKFSAQLKRQGERLEDLTEEEKFYYFLSSAEDVTPEAFERITRDSPVIGRAFHELDKFFWKEEEILRYEQTEKNRLDFLAVIAKNREEGREEGVQAGMQVGMDKGRQKERRLAVQGFAKQGIAIETIALALGIPEAEVNQLLTQPMEVFPTKK